MTDALSDVAYHARECRVFGFLRHSCEAGADCPTCLLEHALDRLEMIELAEGRAGEETDVKVIHACKVPSYIDSVPDDAQRMTCKWRCPECRQKWDLCVNGSHQVADRIGRIRRWKRLRRRLRR